MKGKRQQNLVDPWVKDGAEIEDIKVAIIHEAGNTARRDPGIWNVVPSSLKWLTHVCEEILRLGKESLERIRGKKP